MKFFFTILFFCIVLTSTAQNLVPNPSFEDTVYCPILGEIGAMANWKTYSATPDYYNECAGFQFHVPNNSSGYQKASTGNAYCGLYTYSYFSPQNYREHIGTQLLFPLTTDQKYYVSFKVSLADNAPCATNNLGALFTTNSYVDTAPYDSIFGILIRNFAHINSVSIISDTMNWIIISGTFIADSAYNYIVLGNFYNDSNTTTSIIDNCYSYYYIDNICVSPDSTVCELSASISNIVSYSDNVKVFPNPSTDKLHIQTSYNEGFTVEISDLFANTMLTEHYSINMGTIDLKNFSSGVYIIFIKTLTFIALKKIVIIK